MKPRVTTKCVAECYAGPNERIIEFSFPGTKGPLGGLIQFTVDRDGVCRVHLYRLDKEVHVAISKPTG